MIVVRETTVWDKSPRTPNHTYLLSDNKQRMYGYWNVLDGSFHVFGGKGVNFTPSYRKFTTLAKGIDSVEKARSLSVS